MRKTALCMIAAVAFHPALSASVPAGDASIVPGETVSGIFYQDCPQAQFILEARSLCSYTLSDRGGVRLLISIEDPDGVTLFSTDGSGDDQWTGSGALHWDCSKDGPVTVTVRPAMSGTEGDYAFLVEEGPGWLAADPVSGVESLERELDYPGDVDYFLFQRTDEESVFEISVESDSAVSLFWVNTATGEMEASVKGTEVTMVENYPGGELSKTDSYYGITGPATVYSVSGSVEEEGGLSTWVIVGLAGGVVCILLGIYIYNEAEENCGSCNIFPGGGLDFGNSGCSSSGCSGG